MHSSCRNWSVRRLGRALVLAAALIAPAMVQAALSGPVALSLIAPGGVIDDPTPIALGDAVDPSVGVAAGDGSAIGDFMLPGEFIGFVDNSIRLRVFAGGTNSAGAGVTGLLGLNGDPARYVFAALSVSGGVIDGVDAYAFDGFGTSGTSGISSPVPPSSYIQLASSHRVVVQLDQLVFASRGGGASEDFADLRIDLLTSAVPEPAAAGLMVLGLLGLVLRRRSGSRRSA